MVREGTRRFTMPGQAGVQMAVLLNPPATLDANEEDEPSFDDLLRRGLAVLSWLRRRALLLVQVSVLGAALGFLSVRVLPPPRVAVAEVTLHPEPKVNPVDPDARPRQQDQVQFFVGAERAFTSREAVRRTLKSLGHTDPSDEFVDAVAKRLKFENVGSHDYVASMAEGLWRRDERDPVEFLSAHLKTYVDSEIGKIIKVFAAEVDFLRAQSTATADELKAAEAAIVAFREEHANQLSDQSSLPPEARTQLETRRLDLSGQVRRLEGELNSLRRQLARGSHLERAKLQSTQSYRDTIANLDRQLSEARAQGFADGHPEVKRLTSERANLQELLDEQLRSEVSGIERRSNATDDALQRQIADVESQLSAARAERGFVLGSLRGIREVSSVAPRLEADMAELVRKQDDAKRMLAQLSDRLRRAEVQLELERVSAASRYEITTPPRNQPVRLKRTLVMRGGLGTTALLALAFGVFGFMGLRRAAQRVQAGAAALVLLGLLNGCATPGNFAWARDLPDDPSGEPTLQPRDTILVEVTGQASLSGEFTLRDDGHYVQPMVGSVELAGQTRAQAAALLRDRLRQVVVEPTVAVWLVRSAPVRINVVGEVKAPGSYELARDRSVAGALALAGWITEFAHEDRVYVLRHREPMRVRFGVRDLTTGEAHAAAFRLMDGDTVAVE
jgi:polysaccharide export outer membrane protein